ncbi:MAG: extracellular solute-binding protein, partial [Solirubrobacteraceae bacterium]
MKRTQRWVAICAAGALAAGALSACGSSGSSTPGGAAKAPSASGPTRGQSINVAIAYPAPKALLKQFTAQTGIKVTWDYLQWDDLQTKIASAAQAHSYFADVADVDWSKVGEYYQTKWFLPLNSYFNPGQLKSQYPQLGSFIRDNTLIGMPMDGSLLVTTINRKDFTAAGVTGT